MTRKRLALVSFSLLIVSFMILGITLALASIVPSSAVEAQEAGDQNSEPEEIPTDGETGEGQETGDGQQEGEEGSEEEEQEAEEPQVEEPENNNINPPTFQRSPNNNSGGDSDNLMEAISILRSNPSPDIAQEAIFHIVDGGMGIRPLLSKDALDISSGAHGAFNTREQMAIDALRQYTTGGGKNVQHQGLALNALQMYREMNQVANSLTNITTQCGVDDLVFLDGVDSFGHPCSQLQPLLNSTTGLEDEPVFSPQDTALKQIDPMGASYSINLRADLVPPRWSRDIPEHVEVTGALAPGECSVVFKEFRGLLLQLHLERITDVRDPGNKSGISGSTGEPVWTLQWMPAQYGKQ